MELPVAGPGTERGEGPLIQCPYCVSEAMHKLAQILLSGLAAVCVDGTTGDPFRSPSVVAVDLRREMVDYITQRSGTFIADALIESKADQDAPEAAVLNGPFEVVSVFMDDFISTDLLKTAPGRVGRVVISNSDLLKTANDDRALLRRAHAGFARTADLLMPLDARSGSWICPSTGGRPSPCCQTS